MRTKEELRLALLSTKEFNDNDYLDKYCELLVTCETEKLVYQTQAHHIIPRCYFRKTGVPVDNSDKNVINLLHKDHVKAHIYLALCSSSAYMKSANKRAVTYALNHPCIDCSGTFEELLDCPDVFLAYQAVMEVAMHFSDEHRAKISASLVGKQKGVPKSEEFRQNLRNYYKQNPKIPYVFSEEEKQQIGAGVSRYWRELDDESRASRNNKISSKLRGKPKPKGFSEHLSETRRGINNPFYGKKHSEEAKHAASLRMLQNNPFKGKTHTQDELDRAVQTRRLNGSYGPRIWINNGISNRFIYPHDLSVYELQGYVKGKLPHKKQ